MQTTEIKYLLKGKPTDIKKFFKARLPENLSKNWKIQTDTSKPEGRWSVWNYYYLREIEYPFYIQILHIIEKDIYAVWINPADNRYKEYDEVIGMPRLDIFKHAFHHLLKKHNISIVKNF